MEYNVGDIVQLKSNWRDIILNIYKVTSWEKIIKDFEDGPKVVKIEKYARTDKETNERLYYTNPDNGWLWRERIFEPFKEKNEI